jgi:2-(1,2-epoxy-1,2-dihydrophenyl)acetyl-CoA isomerase
MSFEQIRYEVEAGVALLTLHRPEKLNAYTTEMGDEVVAAFESARADDAVRAVILTGAGRAFCAGVDLDHLKAHMAGGNASSSSEARAANGLGAPKAPKAKLGEEDFLRKLPLDLVTYPKPVIAAINGPAIGVGVTMVLPCDVRIAAENAKLGVTFARLGLLPGLGSTHLLPKLVGRAKALELVLTARIVTAFEAAEIGLVNKVVPAESLLPEARAMAAAMAECRPEVLAAAKAALHFGADAPMADAMRNEQEASAALGKALAAAKP